MKTIAVILAGGSGTRFWPMSRSKLPKQFLKLGSTSETLLQATVRRARDVVGKDGAVWVVTNANHADLVKSSVSVDRIVTEPAARNTAPSIALATWLIKEEHPQSVMVVLPADHAIKNEAAWSGAIRQAIGAARSQELLVTVGIQPTFAHTGYGYIEQGEAVSQVVSKVKRFYEKPSLERAKNYLATGRFLWNAGMFIFRPGVMLKAYEQYAPIMASAVSKMLSAGSGPAREKAISEEYANLESISVDFAIFEHANNCAVVRGTDFGWSDVGSWDVWAEQLGTDAAGNLAVGEALLIDAQSTLIHASHRMVVALGTKDLVIVDGGDAFLVCPKDRVQDIKKVVDELKKKGLTNLL